MPVGGEKRKRRKFRPDVYTFDVLGTQDDAALRIGAAVKGREARTNVAQKGRRDAAATIGAIVKGREGRADFHESLRDDASARIHAAVKGLQTRSSWLAKRAPPVTSNNKGGSQTDAGPEAGYAGQSEPVYRRRRSLAITETPECIGDPLTAHLAFTKTR